MPNDFAKRVAAGSPAATAAIADDDSTASKTPPSPTAAEVDRLLLPPVRGRVSDALRFLLVAQIVYAGLLMFASGPDLVARAVVNGTRLAILAWCVWALRGEGSRRHTLTVAAIGLSGQFLTGLGMSAVRGDVLPTVLVLVALVSVTAVYIPWGARVQGVLAGSAALTLAVASALVYRKNGQHLGFDAAVTVVTAFGITTYIAHVVERSRSTLARHLAEARRTDTELEALRAQLERRVAERTEELEEANRELEGFSYAVSHDLRSPLRSIAGFGQMLAEDHGTELSEDAGTLLAKIRAAAQRMDTLIEAMLMLARVGRSTLRYETVDLEEMARSVAAEMEAEHPGRRVEVRIHDLPTVPGDATLLRAAMDNLLRNAWKYSANREVAHVTVTGARQNDRIWFRVEDDGIGFDPAFRARLFQPFERLHDDKRFRGTGVGLATVARIVRRHGGEIAGEGAIEKGAAFTIFLPAERPPRS